MDSGKEQNYWPGFVDALSNVVLTLVFVLVIFVFALAMASSNVAQRMEKIADQEKTQEDAKAAMTQKIQELVKNNAGTGISMEDLKNQVDETDIIKKLVDQNNNLTQNLARAAEQIQLLHNTLGKSNEQDINVTSDGTELIIMFGDNGISISGETSKKIATYLQNLGKAMGTKPYRLTVEAPDNPRTASISMSREMTLGRNLNVRNVLLANKVPPGNIKLRNVAPQVYGNGYNWVRIRAEE